MIVDEKLDELDEKGNLTGRTINISVAHRDKIPHRIAAILVFRPNGKILVQVHKYHGRRLDHSVGGHVAAGESYEQAAKREMEEELRIKTPLTLIAKDVTSREYYPKQQQSSVVHVFGVFSAKVPADWEHVETEEVDQLVEMTMEEIVKEMNQNPDKFLQGFMTSLGAYLGVTKSPLRINAYGREWGEL